MPSKYASITNGDQSLQLRNWDGVYYWWVEGCGWKGFGEWRKIPKESVPFVEDNIERYKGEWFDSPQEADEHLKYRLDMIKVDELWNSGDEEQLTIYFDRAYEYEETHYPIPDPEEG